MQLIFKIMFEFFNPGSFVVNTVQSCLAHSKISMYIIDNGKLSIHQSTDNRVIGSINLFRNSLDQYGCNKKCFIPTLYDDLLILDMYVRWFIDEGYGEGVV